MGYKITYTNSAFPKDEEFELTGVGLVTNGKAVSLDAEGERDFVARHGMAVKDYFKDSEYVKVEGSSELPKDEREGGEE